MQEVELGMKNKAWNDVLHWKGQHYEYLTS
jgi:hypothetical protein